MKHLHSVIRSIRGALVFRGVLAFVGCMAVGWTFLPGQELVSRPILGAFDTHSAKVWFMVKDADEVAVEVAGKKYSYSLKDRKCWGDKIPVTIEVTGLSPDQTVSAQILLNGKPVGDPFTLRTAPSKVQDSWSFMMGSCTFYGVGATRMVKPGPFTDIFDVMRKHPTDFMLWMGDNVYLLNGEWNNEQRTYEKYTKVRLSAQINEFMQSRPNLAVLDDHDFGPDNGDGSFENKALTSGCFKDFWPNPDYPAEGIYSQFDYQDASFFLMDNRWYRENEKQVLGPVQMEWLKERLLKSRAAFKFITIGSQTINELNRNETWAKFDERQELLDFIREKRITGVVFLSGDRHFTELCKLEQPGLYPLYDFTNSPLTSVLRRQVNRPKDVEFSNPLRIPGTKYARHNYGVVTVSGAKGDRACTFATHDANGKLVWEYTVRQTELDWE